MRPSDRNTSEFRAATDEGEAPSARGHAAWLIPLGVTLLAAAALCWPAWLNGYPLVFSDSGVYIKNSAVPPFHPARAIGYSLFLRWLSFGGSLWSVAVAQALLTAALLGRCAWLLAGRRELAGLTLSLLVVVALTAGPRFVVYLMADIFTAWLLLGAVLWTAARHRLDRLLGAAAIVVAILLHNSHLPIALACALGAVGVALLLHGTGRGSPRGPARAASLLAVVLMALPASFALNAGFTGRPVLLNGTSAYLLNRFVDTGVAGKTLDRFCPERDWSLCPHRHLFEAHVDTNDSWFLFGQGTPFPPTGGWRDPEHDEIVRAAFRCCLPEIVWTTVRGAARQFFAVDSGHSLDAWMGRASRSAISRYYPRDLLDVGTSRQLRDLPVRAVLHPFPETPLHVACLLAAICLGLHAWRRGDRTSAYLLGGVLGLLVANALVTSFGSTLWPRYQARVAWLVPWALTLLAVRAAPGVAEPNSGPSAGGPGGKMAP